MEDHKHRVIGTLAGNFIETFPDYDTKYEKPCGPHDLVGK